MPRRLDADETMRDRRTQDCLFFCNGIISIKSNVIIMCSLKRAFCTYVYCCISFGVPVLVSPDKSLSSSSSVHIFDPNATRNCRLKTIRVSLETWDARALNEKRIIKFALRELEIQGLVVNYALKYITRLVYHNVCSTHDQPQARLHAGTVLVLAPRVCSQGDNSRTWGVNASCRENYEAL